jgi:hypothetical protein
MIYLDTSVALAQLFAEDRLPPASLWHEELISSRLVEYELWTRIHARGLSRSHGDAVRTLLLRIALVELVAPVLMRATEPFPVPMRTLDALHLATVDFLRELGQDVRLASYDARQVAAARALRMDCVEL